MKRKYPKTKGMAVIFEKQRVNKTLDTEVYRELHRRMKQGKKIKAIVNDLIESDTYGWKMMHKDKESWRKGYYKRYPKQPKSVATVNYSLSPINIG